jgi:hypothetical protein
MTAILLILLGVVLVLSSIAIAGAYDRGFQDGFAAMLRGCEEILKQQKRQNLVEQTKSYFKLEGGE